MNRILLLALLLFCVGFFLYSQDLDQDQDSGSYFLTQHLEWQVAEYANYYQVIIQQQQVIGYVEVLRRNVIEPYTDVSLPAGEYRYKVLSFNILGMLDSESEWVNFMIIQIMQPDIFSFSPENFYFDRVTQRMIVLEGVNLLVDSEIYLIRRDASPEDEDGGLMIPREIRRNELGESAQLLFDEESLAAGVYDIYVKNPGGLETLAGPFIISTLKPFDLNFSLGYSPLIKLYSESAYFIDAPFIPVSFGTRVSFLPLKMKMGYIGAELNINWDYLKTEKEEFVTKINVVSILANGLYQYWFIKNALALNVRLGIGFGAILNYHFEYNTGASGDSFNALFFTTGLGVAGEWFFYKQFFLELGMDYLHQTAPGVPLGFLRLMLSVGWQY